MNMIKYNAMIKRIISMMIIITLTFVILSVFCIQASATEVYKRGITYLVYVSRGTAAIETVDPRIFDYETDLSISEIDRYGKTYPVTEVERQAFRNCTKLTSIDLPNVETVDFDAFINCENLSSVNLPSAKIIKDNAFSGCKNLSSVNLPNAETVAPYAFYHNETLSSVDLPNVKSVGKKAFYACYNLSSAKLPQVQTIGTEAFSNCDGLNKLQIPSDIKDGYPDWGITDPGILELVAVLDHAVDDYDSNIEKHNDREGVVSDNTRVADNGETVVVNTGSPKTGITESRPALPAMLSFIVISAAGLGIVLMRRKDQ